MTPTSDAVPVRWGILGAANIAVRGVIPATQQSALSAVVAIASRSIDKAQATAQLLGISRAYGSYQELIDDPDVEAIYNPLPNHLHIPWTIRAAEKGKHVLCEKPIALNAAEAETLVAVQQRTSVQIAEAFMPRTHPQWIAARETVASGRIGQLRLINGHFSYFNRDPANVRRIDALPIRTSGVHVWRAGGTASANETIRNARSHHGGDPVQSGTINVQSVRRG